MTQGERVKQIRKSLNLTLEKFGNALGMKKNSVSQVENGKNNLTEQMAKSICREFNVNEEWLRHGTGEMFLQKSNDELEALAKKYNLSNGACILIDKFVKMKESDREVLLNFFSELSSLLTTDDKFSEDTYNSFPDTAEEFEKLYPPVDINEYRKKKKA